MTPSPNLGTSSQSEVPEFPLLISCTSVNSVLYLLDIEYLPYLLDKVLVQVPVIVAAHQHWIH